MVCYGKHIRGNPMKYRFILLSIAVLLTSATLVGHAAQTQSSSNPTIRLFVSQKGEKSYLLGHHWMNFGMTQKIATVESARRGALKAPGLYFHIEPGRVFLGCGMWRPDPDSLRAVREAIVDGPGRWKRVRDAKRFSDRWELGGASLKRAPREHPADHPMVEDLKRKDHIAFCTMTERDVVSRDLIKKVADLYRRSAPYLRWQAEALDLDF